jgi:hypothetical protein
MNAVFKQFALIAAATMAGLGTIKLYLPPLAVWATVGVLLVGAAWYPRHRIFTLVSRAKFAIYWPWSAFIFAVLLAATTNDLPLETRLFAFGTIVKMIAILAAMTLMIRIGVNVELADKILRSVLLLAAAGFFMALINDDWLVQLGDGRLGWAFAFPGVFWKIGIYTLPFFIWRAVSNPSWLDLPGLVLALLVVALDGSRTGLLAVIALIASISLAALYFGRPLWKRGLCLCLLSVLLSYAVLQPSLTLLIAQGDVGRTLAAVVVLAVTASACLSMAVHFLAGYRDPVGRHQWGAVSGVGVAVVIALLGSFIFATSSPSVYAKPYSERPAVSSPTVNALAVHRLSRPDDTRLQMISNGWDGAVANFPWGGGLGTTTGMDRGTLVHVHMTYLQLLSDIGIVGLASYIGIFSVFVFSFLHLKRYARAATVPIMAIPGVYLMQGAFAPFSNEITEWFPVILAAAVIYTRSYSIHNPVSEV